MIPAGQVWGGAPAAVFVRTLSEQEQLDNYAQSYTSGATGDASSGSVWPGLFDDKPVGHGEQSLSDYNEEHYFKVKN
jgi:hypothetical protein